jgi:hypothetical protein
MFGLRKIGLFISAAALVTALSLGGAGIAVATSSGTPQRAATHDMKPGVTKAPCTSLWAVVNKAGTLQRAGCSGTTSAYVGTGYQVLFPRNVRNCAYVANAGNAGAKDVPEPDIASVAGREGHRDGVFISMVNLSGLRVQRGFDLIVEC